MQLSAKVVGLGRVELPTSPLSGVRSNQLSYRPNPVLMSPEAPVLAEGSAGYAQATCVGRSLETRVLSLLLKGGDPAARSRTATLLRLHPSH